MRNVVAVAMHKPYWVSDENMYLPVQAGAACRDEIPEAVQRDNTGENISKKNNTFCELTVLYWLWKNLPPDVEFAGLCHYRRYFASKCIGGKYNRILTSSQAEKILLSGTAAILPQKRHYWIETNYTQYIHAHHRQDIELTRKIIFEKYGLQYGYAFDKSMAETSGHKFNMFIMQRNLFDNYCTFLFDVLFELEKRLDLSGYSEYDRRVFGFIGERLLDVYQKAELFSYKELPVVYLESQHWPKKIACFLKRKVFGK